MPRAVPVVLALSLFAVGVAPAAEPASKVVEKTLPLAADGRLAIDTYKGRVSVVAWDRAEASIRAVVRPDGECDRAAELVERTQVRIEGGLPGTVVGGVGDALQLFAVGQAKITSPPKSLQHIAIYAPPYAFLITSVTIGTVHAA